MIVEEQKTDTSIFSYNAFRCGKICCYRFLQFMFLGFPERWDLNQTCGENCQQCDIPNKSFAAHLVDLLNWFIRTVMLQCDEDCDEDDLQQPEMDFHPFDNTSGHSQNPSLNSRSWLNPFRGFTNPSVPAPFPTPPPLPPPPPLPTKQNDPNIYINQFSPDDEKSRTPPGSNVPFPNGPTYDKVPEEASVTSAAPSARNLFGIGRRLFGPFGRRPFGRGSPPPPPPGAPPGLPPRGPPGLPPRGPPGLPPRGPPGLPPRGPPGFLPRGSPGFFGRPPPP